MTRRVGRIGDRRTFRALRRSSRRVRRGLVTVTWTPDGSQPVPRVAYAIGRRVGGAVERNRVRRRLRAICDEVGTTLPPGAYLVGVAPGAAQSSFRELRAMAREALEAVTGKELG